MEYRKSIEFFKLLLIVCIFSGMAFSQETDKFKEMRERLNKLSIGQDKTAAQPQAPQGGESPAYSSKRDTAPEELPGMVYVPPAEFLMGTNNGFRYESPEHIVFVEGFHIDKYEVTNMQYKRFLDYTGYPPPKDWSRNNFPKGKGLYPVTNVSFADAEAYAKWSGKRLPAEEEWEKAARFTDSRIYPWGNQWQKDFANVKPMIGFSSSKPVGSCPAGVSKYGAFDMSGNVWEWTTSNFMPYKGNTEPNENYGEKYKVIRGGGYRHSEVMAQSARRDFFAPDKTRTDVGFRCAR